MSTISDNIYLGWESMINNTNRHIIYENWSSYNEDLYGLSSSGTDNSGGGTTTVDSRDNQNSNTTISMTDYDKNHGNNVTVIGTAGDNKFTNYESNVTIFGGAGDDTIDDWSSNVSISGGDGNDSIKLSFYQYVTVYGGKGNDSLELNVDDRYNVVQYANGDGDDTIQGWNKRDTLYVEGNYTRSTVGSDLVVYVGNGSVTFKNTIKDWYEVDVDIETVPAGTFSSAPEPVYTASSSSGSSSSSTTGSSSSSTTDSSLSSSTSGSSSSSVSASQNIYIGGDKTISSYTGQPVTVSGSFMGANFSGSNFVVNSLTGTLTIENVTDKIVDLRDGAGGEFIKAYQASTAGVIDGTGIAAYEIIYGSSAGTDVIFAGDGGSQLWGGSGNSFDAIAGGNGSDIFIGGRYQGSDTFYNVSSADAVNLTDATLSDIVAAVEVNGNIAIGFNTGNIVTIQSTDMLSAAVNLADGSSWRFNHSTKSWQGA